MSLFKKIRVAAATFFIIAISLLFLDFTGTAHKYLNWCSQIQFIPAVLALNVFAIVFLFAILFVFGRIYCSAICPLGICQDIISRLAGIVIKNRFYYKQPKKAFVILRFTILGIFVIALIFNIVIFTAIIEPYSIFGRIISQIFGPVYLLKNNIFAHFAERSGSYAFYSVDIWLKSGAALAVAVISFVVIAIFAVKSGRGYCNTICPVGAFFALFVKFSRIKPSIEKGKCSGCDLCSKNCKARCINTCTLEIDALRCVACFNCARNCPKGAINYLPDTKKIGV